MNHMDEDEMLHDLMKNDRLYELRSELIRSSNDRQASAKPKKTSKECLERRQEERSGSLTTSNPDKLAPLEKKRVITSTVIITVLGTCHETAWNKKRCNVM